MNELHGGDRLNYSVVFSLKNHSSGNSLHELGETLISLNSYLGAFHSCTHNLRSCFITPGMIYHRVLYI